MLKGNGQLVYRAVDMGIRGILAYIFVLGGNNSVKVPNKRERPVSQ